MSNAISQTFQLLLSPGWILPYAPAGAARSLGFGRASIAQLCTLGLLTVGGVVVIHPVRLPADFISKALKQTIQSEISAAGSLGFLDLVYKSVIDFEGGIME